MSKDLWIADYERVGVDFGEDRITRGEAEREMKRLGFDPAEIANELDAIEAEKAKP